VASLPYPIGVARQGRCLFDIALEESLREQTTVVASK
jgi:hypothetical protein